MPKEGTLADATAAIIGSGGEFGHFVDIVVIVFCEDNDPTCKGAPTNSTWSDGKGALYVFYGTAGERLPRTLLVSENDVRIASEHPGDSAGFWFEARGDVTGDGIDDLVIGAPSGCDDPAYQENGACTKSAPGETYLSGRDLRRGRRLTRSPQEGPRQTQALSRSSPTGSSQSVATSKFE